MKLNKQTTTLINWAKKYADCDSLIQTTIEGRQVVINCMKSDVSDLMLMNVSINGDLVISYEFDFEQQKWKTFMVEA